MRLLRALVVTVSAFAGFLTAGVTLALAVLHARWLACDAAAVTLLLAGLWIWATRDRRHVAIAGFAAVAAVSIARIHFAQSTGAGLVTSQRVWRGSSAGGSFLPERDLLAVGARLLPRLWHWPQSAVHGTAFRDAVDSQYAALDADPETRGLESVLLAQAFGTRAAAGHYFLVLPATPSGPHGYPVLLFLHGYGGNSQLYAEWARRIANRFGAAVVLPSSTLRGAWWEPGEQVAAWAALEDAGQHHPLDLQRVIVGGLSNGGVGAAKLARGSRFIGLLEVASYPPVSQAREGLSGKPVVFVGSLDDDRFPIDGLREAADAYRTAGSAVEVIETPGDHLAVVLDPALLERGFQKLCWMGARVCDRE